MTIELFKGIRRRVQKKIQHQDGRIGYTHEADGYEIGDIEVVVDLAQIARDLGAKAMKNKTGRARYMSGAVIVKVVRRERVRS